MRERTAASRWYRDGTLLIIIFPLLLAVGVLTFYLVSSRQVQETSLVDLRDHAILQSSLQAGRVEDSINSLTNLVLVVQEYSRYGGMSSEQLRQSLMTMVKRLTLAEEMVSHGYLLDPAGELLYASRRKAELEPAVRNQLLSGHMERHLPYQLQFVPETRKLFMSIVISRGITFDSILALEIDPEFFFRDLEFFETQEMDGAILTTDGFETVALWDKREQENAHPGTQRLLKIMRASAERNDGQLVLGGHRVIENEQSLFVYKKLNANPFYLGIHYDRNAYLSEHRASFARNITLMSGLILFILVISLLLLYRVREGERLKAQMVADLEQQVTLRTAELEEKSERLEDENAAHRVTENALREQEQQYRNLVEYSPDALILSFEGRVVLVNRMCVRLLGAEDEQQLLGAGLEQFLAEGLLSRLGDGREHTSPVEGQISRLDGRLVDVEVLSAPFDYQGGRAVHVIIRDITQRKADQLEREQLLQAIRQTSEMVFMADLEGNITYVNPSLKRTVGTGSADDGAMSVFTLLEQAGESGSFSRHWQEQVQYTSWSGRVQGLRADGGQFTAEASFSPVFSKNGVLVNVVGVMRDITAELEKEEQHRQSQKLESIGQLAGGVAHDFNNMLGVIIGYTELTMEELTDRKDLYANLQEIHKAAQRSAVLTRQLLAFARKQNIAPKRIDLNRQIDELKAMVRSLIKDDIDLLWRPADRLWPVNADPGQIDQVIINLLLNARDAITGVGKITIETANVTIDEQYSADHFDASPGSYVSLVISDNGCGMDRRTKEKIFDPFFTTKKMGEGTGLGLSMIYGVVRQNSGFINVYSELGEGTSLKIYLPAAAGAMQESEEDSAAADAGQRASSAASVLILLVEDDPALLTLNSAMLTNLGYRVISSSSPLEAVEIASRQNQEINLLITDVVMPGMDGRSLALKLQKDHPDLHCIYVSGYTANVIAHHGILEEGILFLQKPFTAGQLAEAVEMALHG